MKILTVFSSLLVSVVILVSGATSAFSQTSLRERLNLETLPDSVRISFAVYSPDPEVKGIRFYSLADWYKYEGDVYWPVDYGVVVIEEEDEIYDLLRSLQRKDTLQSAELLEKFGIGREIDSLPDSLFYTLYDGKYKEKLKWNTQQKNLLAKGMKNPQMRRNCLDRYFSRYSCDLELFLSGRRLDIIQLHGKDSFQPGILKMAPAKIFIYGMELMREIVRGFVDGNSLDFHKLGWYDYPEHFNKLQECFEMEEKSLLLDNNNVARGGRYTDNLCREYVVTLKLREPFRKVDKVAYPNVRILYSATELDNGLQRVGNLHKKARKVVARVLNVPFFSERVEQKGQRMNVWFFNDRNVNDYLISLVAERSVEFGVGEKELRHSILVEFPSQQKPDMYLLLPDNRIILIIEKGWRYNYGMLYSSYL